MSVSLCKCMSVSMVQECNPLVSLSLSLPLSLCVCMCICVCVLMHVCVSVRLCLRVRSQSMHLSAGVAWLSSSDRVTGTQLPDAGERKKSLWGGTRSHDACNHGCPLHSLRERERERERESQSERETERITK